MRSKTDKFGISQGVRESGEGGRESLLVSFDSSELIM